ncbi:MAG: 23S rRNA (guanosine(2251)-2'-O)-methyltransferase RlmB [Firmicutes bacterium]|nr:23S rRNA (guanosine(2251)-2'-O)-methyltransferase RlmB [Bacillota bacterium]
MRDDKKGNTRPYKKDYESQGKPNNYSKPGRSSDDKPVAGRYSDNKPGAGRYSDNKPGAGRYSDNKLGKGRYSDNKPGEGRYNDNKPAAGGYNDNKSGAGRYSDNKPATGGYSDNRPGAGRYSDNKSRAGGYSDSRPSRSNDNRSGRNYDNRPGASGAPRQNTRPDQSERPKFQSNRPPRPEWTRPAEPESETEQQEFIENRIEGKNPVLEALKAGRTIEKLLIARGNLEGSIREIIRRARDKKIIIQEVDRQRLDEIAQSGAHQGVIAYVTPYSYVEVDEIIVRAKEKGEAPFIIILDEITDPHNLGAIIRTAECCGAHGVIIPKRRSVGLTPSTIKASAGAVEYMPVAKVTNIASTLDDLKKQGIWIAGADVDGQTYTQQDIKGPIALVIGSEGQGIGRLVKEKCDFMIKIPLMGKIDSLNASVAAGILMYEVIRQRG